MTLLLEQRIQNYAERFFLKSGMQSWPDIRTVARGLNVGMSKVFEAVEEGHLCFTQGWNFEPVHVAELEVVTDTDAIEAAWAAYWKSFSAWKPHVS